MRTSKEWQLTRVVDFMNLWNMTWCLDRHNTFRLDLMPSSIQSNLTFFATWVSSIKIELECHSQPPTRAPQFLWAHELNAIESETVMSMDKPILLCDCCSKGKKSQLTIPILNFCLPSSSSKVIFRGAVYKKLPLLTSAGPNA